MRRWTLLTFVILLLATLFTTHIAQATAQGSTEIQSLQINLWPEYDRSDMLVIYRITLSSQTKLPAQISLRIPQAVGQGPNAVAMKDASGALTNLEFKTSLVSGGKWLQVDFTTPMPEIQIEYYDPRLMRNLDRRTFTYTWPGDYTVNSLEIMVQQPVNASQMQIAPSLGSGTVNPDDGLTYYRANVGRVSAGTSFDVNLSYSKSDSKLSMSTQPIQPASSNNASRPILDTNSLLIISGVVLVALILIGTALVLSGYWQPFKPAAAARRRHIARMDRKDTTPSEGSQPAYCHNCGKLAQPGDTFCRACGTKLRNAK